MNRFTPLEEFLKKRNEEKVVMTFTQIEQMVGFTLPQKAYWYRKWWGNNSFAPPCRPKPWQNVGFVVADADLINGRIVFIREGCRAFKQPSQRLNES